MLARFALALCALLWATAVEAATCNWTGGAGNWNNSNTASWSCGHVPTSSDAVVFDGSSGGGTVVVDSPNAAGSVTVQSITMTAFTGTLDFATNDNNVALSVSFTSNGSTARTLSMGDGTWTITSSNANPWNVGGTWTLNCNSSTLVITDTNPQVIAATMGAFTYNIITLTTVPSAIAMGFSGSAGITIGTLNLGSGLTSFANGVTYTITTLNFTNGSSLSALSQVTGNGYGSASGATLSFGNATTPTWMAFRDITRAGAGSIAATSSIDLGHNNTGASFTITTPAAGTGGGGIIGG